MSMLLAHQAACRPLSDRVDYTLHFTGPIPPYEGHHGRRLYSHLHLTGPQFLILAEVIGVRGLPTGGLVMGKEAMLFACKALFNWQAPDDWCESMEKSEELYRVVTDSFDNHRGCVVSVSGQDRQISPLDRQIGGQHYSRLPIQPVEFAMTQGYDFCAASILKYVSRHRQKNGVQDIEKAVHFMELRTSIVQKHDLSRLLDAVKAVFRVSGLTWVSTATAEGDDMDVYIKTNGFTGDDAKALRGLHDWVRHGNHSHSFPKLDMALNDILAAYEPGKRL